MKKTKEIDGNQVKPERSYSDFWLNEGTAYKKSEDESMQKLLNFSAIQGAISNFVKIVTGKTIPVRFNTESDDSYTTGKRITISADTNEKNFDSTVGLSLHESAHVLLSDFELLKDLPTNIPVQVISAANKLGVTDIGTITNVVHRIMNYIEDRRIDYFMYKKAPGYRGYYTSMYNKYWHSDYITEGLKSGSYREEDWNSYDYRILGLSNPATDLDALRGLREIAKIIDLPNIQRLQTTEETLEVACAVAEIVFKNITIPKAPKSQGGKSKKSSKSESDDEDAMPQNFSPTQTEESEPGDNGNSQGDNKKSKEDSEDAEQENTDSGSGKPEDEKLFNDDEMKDAGDSKDDKKTDEPAKEPAKEAEESEEPKEEKPEPEKLSKEDEEKANEAHENQVDFLNGNINKETVSDTIADNLEIINKSDATMEDVLYDYFGENISVPVIVIRNVSDEFFSSEMCLFSERSYTQEFVTGAYEEQVKSGIELGKLLGRRLQIRNDIKKTQSIRKHSGKIVRRLLHEAGIGNDNVFGHITTEQYNKAILHLSIDISGSMSGDKLGNAIITAVSIAQFASMTKNIRVIISVRYSDDHKEDMPVIAIMYDSKVDKFSKVRRMFPYLTSTGCTPEGLCFAAIEKEIIASSKNVKSYFVNFSDGQPYCTIHKPDKKISYTNEPAELHTRLQVNKIRQKGIKIMSFYIVNGTAATECSPAFKSMYGRDAKNIPANSLPALAVALEEMFLEKEN